MSSDDVKMRIHEAFVEILSGYSWCCVDIDAVGNFDLQMYANLSVKL